MTTSSPTPRTIDRRRLVGRGASLAALAAILQRLPAGADEASPAAAIPPQNSSPEAVAAAINAFALELYRELSQGDDINLLFSPYSISMALAMTYAGAKGDTRDQMEDVLGFDVPNLAVHASFADLTDDLLARGNVEPDEERGLVANGLRIANALWGEQTLPFSEDFLAQLEMHYAAGLQQTDFINAPDQARDEINAWVEEQTEDRIQNIVPEGVITSLTRLVLANAIYFYGSWRHDFDHEATRDEPFQLLDGAEIDVPFMYQEEEFAYAELGGMQLVSLPYAAAGLNMTIILPDEGEFEAVEDSLDPETLGQAFDELSSTPLYLWLPKFEFEFSASVASTLQALGMTDAFDPDRADFTGMLDEAADPDVGLVIGDVLHKAFIAVDEKGTEAAAATVVIMEATGAAPDDKPEPVEVRVDRPFLFAIRDSQTGAILFLGRVLDPSS